MTTITHRIGKNRNLTPNEVDANFDRLNQDMLALAELGSFATGNLDGGAPDSVYGGTVALDGGTP